MGQARLPCWISAAILVGMGLVEGFAHFGIPSQIYGSWPVKADRGALALLSGIAIGLGLVGRHRAASALAGIAVGLSGMRVTQALVGGLPNDALSILASLGFFLGSAALVCVHRCRRPWVALGPALAILPLVGSAGFLFAFMLDSEIVSPAEVLNSISPHAASAILLLAAAVLFQAIPGWRRDGHYSPRFVIVTTLAAMASLAFTIWLAVILANHVQAIKQAELQTATAANFLDEHLERSLDGPDLLTRKVAEVIPAAMMSGLQARRPRE